MEIGSWHLVVIARSERSERRGNLPRRGIPLLKIDNFLKVSTFGRDCFALLAMTFFFCHPEER